MNLFGKAKKAPSTKDTINTLQETLDMLEKREKFLHKKIDAEVLVAKQHLAKRTKEGKIAAKNAIRRKKTFEKRVQEIEGAKLTIETQVDVLHNAQITQKAMGAMKMGAQTMKNVQQGMTVADVDDTMDDIREQMDVANEISDAIAQPIGLGAELDDDELEAELAELEEEELAHEAPAPVAAAAVAMPAAPTAAVHEAFPAAPTAAPVMSAEEQELRELEAEMTL